MFGSEPGNLQIRVGAEKTGSATILTGGKELVMDRLIVKFRDPGKTRFLKNHIARGLLTDATTFIIQVPPELVASAVARYRAMPEVEFAEPDSAVRVADVTPDDPYFSNQWALGKIGAPAAWDTQTDSSDVIVAIVDTGISYAHPDLKANLWTDPETGAHGFSCFYACTPGGEDDYGHGTHVAGIIGAATGNATGVAGVNWKVQLLSMKFLYSNGAGWTSDAVVAFDKLVELRHKGYPIRVSNNSWGGGQYSKALKYALQRAEEAGILIVAAAGNSQTNADLNPAYPASYPLRGIVSVMATDINDARAPFSNYGLANVDLGAPGVDVLSTVPTSSCELCDPSGYHNLSGTSMAAPHVSGVAAALFHRNPSLTPWEMHDLLLDPASLDAIPDAFGPMTTTGGRLNFQKALQNPLLLNPILNGFPQLQPLQDIWIDGGQTVLLNALVSDPEQQPLQMRWKRGGGWGSLLLSRLNDVLVNTNQSLNPLTFTAPSFARDIVTQYGISVADGHGGSDSDSVYVTFLARQDKGSPPVPDISVTPLEGPPGTVFTVRLAASDADNDVVYCSIRVSGHYLSYTKGIYNLSRYSQETLTFQDEGVYGVTVECMDGRLVPAAEVFRATLRVGNPAPAALPIPALQLDKDQGTVPLTVNWDASASYDPDGIVKQFFVFCYGFGTSGVVPPAGECTYSEPGEYELLVLLIDDAGFMSTIQRSIVVLPPPGPHCPEMNLYASDTLNPALLEDVDITLFADGGSAPYSYSLVQGTLPPGLVLESTGHIHGKAQEPGTFHYTIAGADTTGCSATRDFTLQVAGIGGSSFDTDSNGWWPIKGIWSIDQGYLKNTTTKTGIVESDWTYGTCVSCTKIIDFKMMTPGGTAKFYPWFRDPRDYLLIQVIGRTSRIKVIYKIGGVIVKKIAVPFAIEPGTTARLQAVYDTATGFSIRMNDQPIATFKPAEDPYPGTIRIQNVAATVVQNGSKERIPTLLLIDDVYIY